MSGGNRAPAQETQMKKPKVKTFKPDGKKPTGTGNFKAHWGKGNAPHHTYGSGSKVRR